MKRMIRKTIEAYGTEDATIEAALVILAQRMKKRGAYVGTPSAVRDYLRLTLMALEVEAFWGVFLDSQNRVLAVRELSRGTLTTTSVHAREVVKVALAEHAASIIFAHNHPSGLAEPSRADEVLTMSLKQALALVDVKVLDHFVVGGTALMSFAERGLL